MGKPSPPADPTAVEYIDRFGLLGPQMTLGHGVWLNEPDIERLAKSRSEHARIRTWVEYGMTISQVAEVYGVAVGVIERILRQG